MQFLAESLVELITQTSTNLPLDVREAMSRALGTELPNTQSSQALNVIASNIDMAAEDQGPICQDTGMPTFVVHTPVGVNQIVLKSAIQEAVAEATRVLALQDGPTVLAGHSFSGMIVTEAGMHPNVSALVYVAARAPDAGEDYTALAAGFPPPPASTGIVFEGDEGRLGEAAFLRDFAGDIPPAQARVLYAEQQPFHKALLTGRTTQAAWRSKPSFYAVSTQDRTIDPDLQRFMAKRMRATTIELPASHVSLLSHPQEVADLIISATQGVR